MKMELTYEIQEVTRYRIVRKHEFEGAGNFTSGFDTGHTYGEFDNRDKAETVKAALEANAASQLMKAV